MNLKTMTLPQAEAVNTACYVQNRVLVIKPHNKTPYELFLGRKPALSFMRPFGCPVTILNTLDHLGKFDEKADEGFFVGYSTNSKAFRVFNSRTRIVEENLHVMFSEDTPNIAGSGPKWLFDIDALTKSINYQPVVVGNQYNGNADPSFSSSSKDSSDAKFKPSGEEKNKNAKDPENEDSEVPNIENPRVNQEKDANVNSTNNINIVSSPVNGAGIEDNAVDENIVYECDDDPNMPNLEEIVYSDDDEGIGAEADMTNLNTHILVSPILTINIYKDHLVEQIIRDIHSAPQTRRMSKSVTNHEPKKTLVDLPYGKRAIGTKWVYRNKKDKRGIVIRNKTRLVAQGHTQEEGIDYYEVFDLVARIEAIRLFLAYASFKDFVVYHMNVKSAFLYGKIEKEVYVCQPPRFEDPEFPDIVYKVEKALYCLHQAPRACDMLVATVRLGKNPPIGGCQFLGSRLISWQCKKQTVLANSTTEAEYIAASSCCGQVLWIQNQLLDYGYNFMNTKIFIDNESTICIVKNPVSYSKTNHIKIRHHFIKDSNEKKLIQMIKIHTDQNVADLLTKAFDVSRFQYLITTNETVIKEWKDRMERAATTASSLEAEQDSGNINRTQSMSTLNESFPQGTGSGSGPRYALTVNPTIYTTCIKQLWATSKVKTVNREAQIQALVDEKKVIVTEISIRRALHLKYAKGTDCIPTATIFAKLERMGEGKGFSGRDTPLFPTMMVQASEDMEPITDESINEEHVCTPSCDPPQSGEDRMQLNELINLCTKLSDRVLALENANTSQAAEIATLKERIKKMEKKRRNDEYLMFDTNVLNGDEVFEEPIVNAAKTTSSIPVSATDPVTTAGEVVTTASATGTTVDELTLAQTLIEIKAAKPKAVTTAATIITTAAASTRPKAKGIVFHDQEEQAPASTPIVSPSQPSQVKDKGKAKMIEEEHVKNLLKKEQIRLDEEFAFKIQDEEQEQERIAREKAQKIQEANIAWDDI
ncbi:putative reverse transcriptase, RNA-dependent DNA polymerase [Tanacetum coccineum]